MPRRQLTKMATPAIPYKDPNYIGIPEGAKICYKPGPDANVTKWAFELFLMKNIKATIKNYPSQDCNFVVYGHNILGETIEEVVAKVSKRTNAISLTNFIEIVNQQALTADADFLKKHYPLIEDSVSFSYFPLERSTLFRRLDAVK